jgi:hypothetical protein
VVEDNSKEVKNWGKGEEQLVSNGVFEQMTMEDLVRVYNGTNPATKIKGSFDSISQGVRMILERLVFLKRRCPSKIPKVGKDNQRRADLRQRLDLPKKKPDFKIKMEFDLELDTVLALLRWGIDSELLIKVMRWKGRSKLRDYLKKVNNFTGFAIYEDENFVAHIREE